MATFFDSFDHSVTATESNPSPLDSDSTFVSYDAQQFNSFANESDVFRKQLPICRVGENVTSEEDRKDFGGSDGPILPSPPEMEVEEGFALREWRRESTIRLEEKEKREKELLSQIMQEADEFKVNFYRKREVTCENNMVTNREKEKLFLANQEKFYAEADKDYWKAIAELIPREVAVIEKKGKKDQDKKPNISVIQGPKPGKPAELSRMRQILLKLKHEAPLHLKHSSKPTVSPADDDKAGNAAVIAPTHLMDKPAAITTKVVVIA